MKFLTNSFASTLLLYFLGQAAQNPADNWPSFRGYRAQGIAQANIKIPQSWSVPDNKNVKWRTAIPGLAHSCPIVWGNQIFTTTAINSKGKSELKLGLYGNIAPVADPPSHSTRTAAAARRLRTTDTSSPRARTLSATSWLHSDCAGRCTWSAWSDSSIGISINLLNYYYY